MTLETHPGLYEDGYLRLPQIVGDRYASPVIPPIVPVSKTTIWAWVKEGKFPAPAKLGPRTSAWKVSEVRAWLDATARQTQNKAVTKLRTR